MRAAILARQWREQGLIQIDKWQWADLLFAIHDHTKGKTSTCKTIGTCWDADRLDLSRVGTRLNADYLSTAAARAEAIQKENVMQLEDLKLEDLVTTCKKCGGAGRHIQYSVGEPKVIRGAKSHPGSQKSSGVELSAARKSPVILLARIVRMVTTPLWASFCLSLCARNQQRQSATAPTAAPTQRRDARISRSLSLRLPTAAD